MADMLRQRFGKPGGAPTVEAPEADPVAAELSPDLEQEDDNGSPLMRWLSEPPPLPPALDRLKETVHQQLVDELDPDALDPEGAHRLVREVAAELLTQQEVRGVQEYRERLVNEIVDEVLGYSVLEPLLRDDAVTEIMVNAPDHVYVECAGRLYRSTYGFRDEEHLMRVIERIVAPLGRRVDEASPMVDARLPDGSRVNVVVPPAAPGGAKLTLRKFARQRLRAEDLVRLGALTADATEFLQACVTARLNILISGGTGSGKTTLLNAMSSFISEDERIVTIEDPLELQLQQPHVVALEARPPGLEGTRQVTQRDLVRNSLRMRPDRIIVGEVRGPEAFDMLQAMNTGHEGSISTVHANSPRDALARVENMVMMAGFELPDRAIREQVASAIHLMVHVSRMPDGSRRVTHITEVVGMEGATVTLQDLFLFRTVGRDGRGRLLGDLAPTGLQPHHATRFDQRGVILPSELFHSERWTA
jgi:pilus assembly protein CpaF